MQDRLVRGRTLAGPAAVLALIGLAGVGCGTSDEAVASGCPPVTAAAGGALEVMPKGLRLHELGKVTGAAEAGNKVTVSAVADGTVSDRAVLARDHFDALGWTVVGFEDEGVEAEVFLVHGADTGAVHLTEDGCPGRTAMEITLVSIA